jgi:ATP-dependent DNA helicase DinG
MIRDFFQPGGDLEAGLEGYEDRPEQHLMAEAVAHALEDGSSLLVEAGTGTGKSLAYLLPAIHSDLRVVVSTGTRSLQDQLLKKDLPVLQELVAAPFVAVPLKGTSNYLCLRKFAAKAAQPLLPGNVDEEWEAVEEWARTTQSGDRAELESIPEDAAIWSQVTTGPESRMGPRCPHYDSCFVTKARRNADSADLVVVNHHLFFADLALRNAQPGARVLPEYEAVVFDEAHGLEEVMTEHFGVDISTGRIDHLIRDWKNHLAKNPKNRQDMWMPNRGEGLVAAVAKVSQRFFADVRHRIAPLAKQNDGERFTLPEDLIDETLKITWFALDTALEELFAHGKHGSDCLRDPSGDAEFEVVAEELRILAERCQRVRDDLAIADRDVGKGDYVFWGQSRGMAVSLHASPVGVEEVLQRELQDKVRSLVFTSATLSAGGHFAHIRGRLGLGPDTTEELRVESPFDYRKQCLLYLPRDIPDPRAASESAARHVRIAELLHITDGHALVLFTSYRAMQDCYRALRAQAEFPLWIQGQAPRAALLEMFRSTPRSVLLATNSFWEGIDVPGEALSHVLIDKLPFDVPSDPLNEARMARLELAGNSAFDNYQLPRAAIAFRQGFGRLIRRKCDRGIVTVLDPRIVTKRYGRFFLDSLPEVGRTSALEQARRWWQEGRP